MQTGILEWFSQNTLLTFVVLFIFFVAIFAIYIKLYVRIIYPGTLYKHYRKGRLLMESDKGGTIFLLPFLDRLEIIPQVEPSIDDIVDSLGNNK